MLLNEFENSRAVIEPTDVVPEEIGEVCDTLIFSFNGEIVDRIRHLPETREAGYVKSLNGRHPWYIFEENGQTFALMLAIIGAPMAVEYL